MKRIFTDLKLTVEFQNYTNTKLQSLNCIEGLSLINIFVGANNSGKSRFLREIAKIKDFEFHLNIPDTKKYMDLINALTKELNSLKTNHSFIGIEEIDINGVGKFHSNHFKIISHKFYSEGDKLKDIQSLIDLLKALKSEQFIQITRTSKSDEITQSFGSKLMRFILLSPPTLPNQSLS